MHKKANINTYPQTYPQVCAQLSTENCDIYHKTSETNEKSLSVRDFNITFTYKYLTINKFI